MGVSEVHQQQQKDDKLLTEVALISAVQPSCCYCSKSHKSVNCQTVVQVSARKQILKKANRCFICLKRGHLS